MQELESVSLLRGGNIAGLEALVREHYAEAVRVAYLITRDCALAEDVAQEAFIRAYEGIAGFDPTRPFAPWLFRIVVNCTLNATKRRAREDARQIRHGLTEAVTIDATPDTALGPEESLERSEMRQSVWTALGELPPKQRAAVVLRYYLGRSEAEMAQELGCSRGTVKWRLHAARRKLQGLLTPPTARGGTG